ncbi:MAG: hypothetical protein U1E23_07945 [Reyranellaceae bacterium]
MAAPLIRRLAWPAAAVLALAFLATLALQGRRPDAGLVPFVAGGPLTAFAPAEARRVDIASGGRTWLFRRVGEAWQPVAVAAAPAADAGTRIDEALRLLRDSAPLRVVAADEMAGGVPAEFGLGGQPLAVVIEGPGGARFGIRFGATNPLGVARYAQVDGARDVLLLATYVAEAWQRVLAGDTP